MPSMTSKLTTRKFRERFRKEGGKKEGRKELTGYTSRDGFALSVYVLRSISLLSKRLPLRLYYSEALSCYRGLWPGGMYPGRLPYPWLSLYSSAYTRLRWLHLRLCAPTERAGVCLRVHYVDCWSWPLRRTQRTSKRLKAEEGRGEDGWEAGEEKEKGKRALPLSPVSKWAVCCIPDAHGF